MKSINKKTFNFIYKLSNFFFKTTNLYFLKSYLLKFYFLNNYNSKNLYNSSFNKYLFFKNYFNFFYKKNIFINKFLILKNYTNFFKSNINLNINKFNIFKLKIFFSKKKNQIIFKKLEYFFFFKKNKKKVITINFNFFLKNSLIINEKNLKTKNKSFFFCNFFNFFKFDKNLNKEVFFYKNKTAELKEKLDFPYIIFNSFNFLLKIGVIFFKFKFKKSSVNFYLYFKKFLNLKSIENIKLFDYEDINKSVFSNNKIYFNNEILNILIEKDNLNLKNNNFGVFSNKFIINNFNSLNGTHFNHNDYNLIGYFSNENTLRRDYFFNNLYPIFFLNNRGKKRYEKKYKSNINAPFYNFFQNYLLSFLENFLKRKILLRVTTSSFRKYPHVNYLKMILDDNFMYKPLYMKNYFIEDFIKIVWYTFWLKDLNIIASWIKKFMESVHFRHHKKFLSYFNNFIKKNSSTFLNFLNIKGFFFDIRGKVGVAGNSKKRHFFFKIGVLNRSCKSRKIDFNQNLVRTPSGVLGLTYILNY